MRHACAVPIHILLVPPQPRAETTAGPTAPSSSPHMHTQAPAKPLLPLAWLALDPCCLMSAVVWHAQWHIHQPVVRQQSVFLLFSWTRGPALLPSPSPPPTSQHRSNTSLERGASFLHRTFFSFHPSSSSSPASTAAPQQSLSRVDRLRGVF